MNSNPLSIKKYILNNKKKIALVTIIAVLGVILLFTSKGIIESIENKVVKAWALPFENLSIVVPGEEYNSAEDIAVEKIYITGATGRISTYAFFTTEDGMYEFIELSGIELLEGRLPGEGTNEIIVHEDIVKNQGWELGTTIGTSLNENDSLGGEFIISGIIDSKGALSIGSLSGIRKNKDKIIIGKLVLEENVSSNTNVNYIYSYDNEMVDIKNYGTTLTASMVVLLLIITVVNTITISFLLYLFYLQRSSEFGILMAMGYSRGFVIKKTLLEVFIILLFSLVIGIVGGLLILILLNSSIFDPIGQAITLFNKSYLSEVTVMMIIIYIFSSIPIINMIRRIDPINVIGGGGN